MATDKFLSAETMVKRLELELESARRNWAVFSESNGKDESERAPLRSGIANTYAAHAFAYIQMSCAINAVMALARITDKGGKERNSLDALKGLIGPIQSEIADRALHWYSGLDAHFGSSMGREAREEVAHKLPELISKITDLLNSDEVFRIRTIRNEALAHSLALSAIQPTYDDIGIVFRKSSVLVSLASHLVCGRPWDPEDFDRVPWSYAKEFWDVVEHGLQTMRDKNLI